jgi:hypothetical protein
MTRRGQKSLELVRQDALLTVGKPSRLVLPWDRALARRGWKAQPRVYPEVGQKQMFRPERAKNAKATRFRGSEPILAELPAGNDLHRINITSSVGAGIASGCERCLVVA